MFGIIINRVSRGGGAVLGPCPFLAIHSTSEDPGPPHSVVNDSKPQTGEMDVGAELMSGEAARYSR